MPGPIIEAEQLELTHPATRGMDGIVALRGLTFTVRPGELVAVIGRSGAGKTTLLRCMTGFVRPSAGRLVVDGIDVGRARGRALRRLRRQVATIYQHFNLVERASAFDNALFGRLGHVGVLRSLLGWFPGHDRRLAYAALDELGMADRALQRADRLSGGERQRVAIARALVQQPDIVLADEPASSLDIALTRFVLDTLQRLNRDHGLTVVVNLHDLDLAVGYASRILGLRRGRLVFDGPPEALSAAVKERIYDGTDAEDDLAAGARQPAGRAAAAAS